MRQSSRLILTSIFFVILLALARYITGRWFYLPSGDESIWFQSGLLMVVLGSFFIEQHFTKPVDVVANVAAAVVTLLSIEHKENFVFWTVAFYSIIGIGFLAFVSMIIQTFSQNSTLLKVGKLFFEISTFFGNAKRLFSVVLFLSLISYFEIPSTSSLLIFVFWAVVVTAEPIGIPNLIEKIIDSFRKPNNTIGKLHKVAGRLYQIELTTNLSINNTDVFMLSNKETKAYLIPLNDFIISDKRIINTVIVGVPNNFSEEKYWDKITDTPFVKSIKQKDLPASILSDKGLVERSSIIGIVDDNTDIEQLRFKLLSPQVLNEGQLVKLYINEKPVIFQIVNAITKSEQETGDESKYIAVIAQQVGVWDPDSCRFESVGWVAEPGSLVFGEFDSQISLDGMDSDRHRIGNLPRSKYPIHVNIHDIVTHHTAILGITGSGKTFLAYDLIKQMIAKNIKVIVFDVSRDYARELSSVPGLTMLATPADVATFLNSSNYLGIAEFRPSATDTIVKTTASAVQHVLEWAKGNLTSQQGENLAAKVCVVFEEAHSLIPEWNSTSIQSDRDQVNKVSQAILQGRKYGVGALVITQRTANITKTILNQCNTIFALQSFDQTGLEFLKNYIGDGHAQALSTLLPRQAVIFGKASSSRRPVIVKLDDR